MPVLASMTRELAAAPPGAGVLVFELLLPHAAVSVARAATRPAAAHRRPFIRLPPFLEVQGRSPYLVPTHRPRETFITRTHPSRPRGKDPARPTGRLPTRRSSRTARRAPSGTCSRSRRA